MSRGLEYLQMELGEPDASGRRRPVPIEGSETILDVDMVISAISQQPDIGFMEKETDKENITITRWNTFDNDPETLQCSVPYLFTGGDVATGPSLVVDAIGGGRRAARSIHQYITGEEIKGTPSSLRKRHIPESLFETVPGVVKSPRTPMPELAVAERIDLDDRGGPGHHRGRRQARIQPLPRLLPDLLQPGPARPERRLKFSFQKNNQRCCHDGGTVYFSFALPTVNLSKKPRCSKTRLNRTRF